MKLFRRVKLDIDWIPGIMFGVMSHKEDKDRFIILAIGVFAVEIIVKHRKPFRNVY